MGAAAEAAEETTLAEVDAGGEQEEWFGAEETGRVQQNTHGPMRDSEDTDVSCAELGSVGLALEVEAIAWSAGPQAVRPKDKKLAPETKQFELVPA